MQAPFLRIIVIALGLCVLTSVRAQNTFETLHSAQASLEPNGELVEASDGNFYGTCACGGRNGVGSVFKITPAGVLTMLHSFDGTTGVNPQAGLVQGTDGAFYGTTRGNEDALKGTVFRVTSDGEFTTLHAFSGSNGEAPNGGLAQGSDGAFYGTTRLGGTYNKGTVFKVTPAGKFTTLQSFNGTKGEYPFSGLAQGSDGAFYGATSGGGSDDKGTAFKISSTGVLTILSDPRRFSERLLPGSDGAFYSVSGSEVIRMSESGVSTVLYSKSSNDGIFEGRLAQDGAGNLYGAINDFFDATSKLFKLSSDGVFTILHTFSRVEGRMVMGGLIWGSDGALYGATAYSGTSNQGTVFKITVDGTFTALHSFNNPSGNGKRVLKKSDDGGFYGITERGGEFGQGTVFKITPGGVHTVLYSFDGDSFAVPRAGVVQGDDGNFYLFYTAKLENTEDGDGLPRIFRISPAGEATELMGSDGYPVSELVKGNDGCIYCITADDSYEQYYVQKITPPGSVTKIHTWAGNYAVHASLILGSDGGMYGIIDLTDFLPGLGGEIHGEIFKVSPAGDVTTLHVFNGANGSAPRAMLVQGSDGTLYGATEYGGIHNLGTIFKITPDGEFTTLHSFNGTKGERPRTQLVLGSDGHLYGTCNVSYPYSDPYNGTVFKISAAGKFSNLVFFKGTKAIRSADALLEGQDGNFYGVSRQGGSESRGALFQVTPTGKFTLLHSFQGDDGSYPTELLQGQDGAFYGTAATMSVWRFRVAQKPVMVNPGPQQHHVGQVVNLPLTASENPSKFLVKGLPKGLRYDASTQSIVGQPTTPKLDKNKQPAAYEVKIRAANNLGAGPEAVFNWTILPLSLELTGNFEGLVAAQAEVNDNLGGSLRFTVTASGAVTGKLWVGGRLQSFKGNLEVAADGASAVLQVTLPGKSPADVVTLELNLADGQILPGSRILRNGGEAVVSGGRGESLPAKGLLGTFHTALEATETGENIPGGTGWAVLKVRMKGVAVWTGRLADGSSFIASQITNSQGRVPCFVMLYRGNGALHGWAQVDADSGDLDDVGGFTWVKKPEPGNGRVYKDGIPSHTLQMQGGRYALNEVGLILDFAAPGPGTVSFTGGGLLQVVEQPFELLAKNGIRLPKGTPVKLSLTAKTGLISTSFVMQIDGKRLPVKGTGLLVPRRSQGLGHVLVPQSAENNSALRSATMLLKHTP